jgi:hypothetical protein
MRKGVSKLLFALLACVCAVCFLKTDAQAATAVKKNIDTTFKDSLEETTSENWYELKTGKNSYFTLSFIPEETLDYGWDVSILDEEYNEVKSYGNITNNFTSARLTLGDNATFYIKVKYYIPKWTKAGISYSIKTEQVKRSDWEKESNATTSKATKLTSGKKMNATLWKKDDVDYFKFKTTKTGYAQVNFCVEDEEPVEYGWNFYILDSKGNVVYEEEDVKENYISRKLAYKKGTTFYVKVERRWSNDKIVDVWYSVKVKEYSTSKYEVEPNDNTKKATTIKSGASKTGTILNSSDVDCYKYTAAKDKKVSVKFSIEGDVAVSQGWDVTIYRKSVSDNNIVVSENKITNDKTLKFKAKKGYEYYIVVKPHYNDVYNVCYKVKVS